MFDGPLESHAIFFAQEVHDGVVPFAYTVTELEQGQHRGDEYGKDKRANQREGNRPGHGLEEAPFDALQGKNGQVCSNDDGACIKDGPQYFLYRIANSLHRRLVRAGRQAEVPHDVFNDHHGAVHHHAEIQCTQGEKIGGNVVEVETNGGKQQRKWNGQRHNNGAAKIAEKEEKNDGDQQHAFGQVMKHGVRGQMHEVAAVQERNNLHSGRKNALVQLLHLFMNGYQRFIRIGALPQEDDSLHGIFAIEDRAICAANGFADLPQANFRTLRDDANVLDANGSAILRFDQLLFHLADAEAVSNQLAGVQTHLILAGNATKTDHVHDVGNRLELLFESPILDGLQFHRVILRVRALQRVPVNLSHRAPVRAHLRL